MIIELLFGLGFPIGGGADLCRMESFISALGPGVYMEDSMAGLAISMGATHVLATVSRIIASQLTHWEIRRLCARTKGASVPLSHGLAHDRRGHRPCSMSLSSIQT
jgi:hypothetical protein